MLNIRLRLARLILRTISHCDYVSDLPMRGGGFHTCVLPSGHEGGHMLGTPEAAERQRKLGYVRGGPC